MRSRRHHEPIRARRPFNIDRVGIHVDTQLEIRYLLIITKPDFDEPARSIRRDKEFLDGGAEARRGRYRRRATRRMANRCDRLPGLPRDGNLIPGTEATEPSAYNGDTNAEDFNAPILGHVRDALHRHGNPAMPQIAASLNRPRKGIAEGWPRHHAFP